MMKERAAGTYRLSSYLLAKSFSDMPLVMLQVRHALLHAVEETVQ
jgi:hypothetical protein